MPRIYAIDFSFNDASLKRKHRYATRFFVSVMKKYDKNALSPTGVALLHILALASDSPLLPRPGRARPRPCKVVRFSLVHLPETLFPRRGICPNAQNFFAARDTGGLGACRPPVCGCEGNGELYLGLGACIYI